jgi:hypothetical protein
MGTYNTYLRQIGYTGEDQIQNAQNWVQWRDFRNTAVNIQVL